MALVPLAIILYILTGNGSVCCVLGQEAALILKPSTDNLLRSPRTRSSRQSCSAVPCGSGSCGTPGTTRTPSWWAETTSEHEIKCSLINRLPATYLNVSLGSFPMAGHFSMDRWGAGNPTWWWRVDSPSTPQCTHVFKSFTYRGNCLFFQCGYLKCCRMHDWYFSSALHLQMWSKPTHFLQRKLNVPVMCMDLLSSLIIKVAL